jgi:hypothetical protein
MIGRDSRGHWVVQEPGGMLGGLFVNCSEALKFVKNANAAVRPHAVVWVSGILELNASFAPAVRSDQQPADNTFSFRQRRFA